MKEKQDRRSFMYYVFLKEDPSKNYIGVSINPKRRWQAHRSAALRGGPYHFQRALAKYGADNFEWTIITSFRTEAYAKRMERFARQVFKIGTLNMTDGGEGREGYTVSEETRKKIGDGNRGKVRTPEQREVIRQSRLGTKLSEETKRKVSEGNKGKKISPEHKAILSKLRTGAVASEETRRRIGEAGKGRPMPAHVREILNASLIGKPKSEETRAKISKANKGRKHTEEAKLKMSETRKGRVTSEETRAKLSVAGKGRKDSPEALANKKAAALKRAGKPRSEETVRKQRESLLATNAKKRAAKEAAALLNPSPPADSSPKSVNLVRINLLPR